MMQSLRDVNRKNDIYVDDSELLLNDKTIFRFCMNNLQTASKKYVYDFVPVHVQCTCIKVLQT